MGRGIAGNRIRVFLHAWGLCVATGVTAPCAAVELGGTVTLASDYVRRGTSQNLGDPVLQGSVFVVFDDGWYASVFASNVAFVDPDRPFDDGANLEVDYLAGFSTTAGRDMAWGVSVAAYRYPGARSFARYDYLEWRAEAIFRDRLSAAVTWSDDYNAYYDRGFGQEGRALTVEVAADWPLNDRFAVAAGVGFADLGDVFGTNTAFWKLGVTTGFAPFVIDVGWYASDARARRLYGDDVAGARLVVGITARFP